MIKKVRKEDLTNKQKNITGVSLKRSLEEEHSKGSSVDKKRKGTYRQSRHLHKLCSMTNVHIDI
jgi:hypothetical protein